MPRPLPARLQPDSIREFRAAARVRFEDGVSLAASGRRTAAVYLWGYSGEMTVKAAYFALVGFTETQHITLADLRAAVASATFAWPGPNLHDVGRWAQLLVNSRAALPGRAYPDPTFATQVVLTAGQLQRHWREVLRYHKNVAYEFEMHRVRDAADWLLAQSLAL